MEQTVLCNEKGFTLIEVLVSLVILTVISVAVLKSLSLYAGQNVENTLRDEAVEIAQECAERLRLNQACSTPVTRNFRNFSVQYNIVAPNPTSFSSGTNTASIQVTYSYKSRNYSYSLNTVVYRQ